MIDAIPWSIKMGDLVIGYDNLTLTLGALASLDAISVNSKVDSARLNGFRTTKIEYWIDYLGKTAGEGPIMVGWAPFAGAALAESAIEADPQSSSDKAAIAEALVPVFPLVMLPQQDTAENRLGAVLKEEITPMWSTIEGNTASWWAYNMDGSALTAGTIIRIFAKYFGVWLRD